LIRSKLYAVFLGPSGLGVISQLFNFTNLVSNIINLGVPLGLSSKIPGLAKENTESAKGRIRAYIEYFLIATFAISISLTILLAFFSDTILNLLIGNSEFKIPYIIIVFSIPFIVSYSIIESVLRGLGQIKTIVMITVASSCISICALFPLVYFYNYVGVSFYILVLAMLPLLIFILKYRKNFSLYFNSAKQKLLQSEKSIIYRIGVVSIVSTLLHQGSMILLRKIIISNLGMENNGIYQSVLSISQNSFALVYIFLTNYTLPKLSELSSKEEITSEINNNFRLLLLFLTPAVVLVFTFREYIILILFSSSFLEGANLLSYQLAGDIFRALGALFGLWLIPQMKIKQILTIDILFNIVFISLPFVFVDVMKNNLSIVPLCYMVAFSFHFALYYFYSRKEISFRFSKITLKYITYSLPILFITFFISKYSSSFSLIVNLICLLVWFYLITEKNERRKLYELTRFKKNKV
jgi:PST family polysaccharide transporter